MVDHVGTQPNPREFERFIDDLMTKLPEDIKRITVFESLYHLVGQELSPNLMRQTVWWLSGNLQKLRDHQIIYPWKAQGEIELVPVQILTADFTTTFAGDPGYRYQLRVLAGSSCPMKIYKTWTSKTCSYIARQIGFSAPWKAYPYKDGHELVSMRFLAEIDPKFCRDSKPGFDKISCTGSLIAWNKRILKARAHLDPPCPFGFTHACYRCPVGYDNCMAGTHPKTYELQMCNICDKQTNHDPASDMTCVNCKNKTHKG